MSAPGSLKTALETQEEGLLNCVHCGFCLPACPTYRRLGDEADSPRGRLYLMRAVVEGRMDPGAAAFQTHIDRCLGCRACEPVCPSGVEYGRLLEHARHAAARHVPPSFLTRGLLAVMGSRLLRTVFFFAGRVMRASRIASMASRVLPARGSLGNARLGLAMLASSGPWRPPKDPVPSSPAAPASEAPEPGSRGTVGLLLGCVQRGLYGRINRATVRTLEVNGFRVKPVRGQTCCGALHAHGGDLDRAKELARANVEAFRDSGVDYIVVNAAGCGAAMKEYHALLDGEGGGDEARDVSRRVRDVTELLAAAGPRRGAAVPCVVAYDHPCHLIHAQGVSVEPLQVLAAVPGVDVRVVPDAEECCGGAGIYGMTHPDLGGRIGGDKVKAVRETTADVACTPNPGCMMQIGAGLRLAGDRGGVCHPVELLDSSYERAGYYR